MTKTHHISPPVDAVLDDFFAGYQQNASAAVMHRIDAARMALERALEAEGTRILNTPQLERLEVETGIDLVGAVARTMRPDDLYYALPLCLRPVHALESLLERETQLDVIAALADYLWRAKLITGKHVSECAIIEFDLAVRRGREFVKAARAATR
jgi:hypothetical protein